MTKPTTTLPTEPGHYLFIGVRDGRIDRINKRPQRVELVRVFTNNQDQLNYVGADFFYHPEKAVGAWLPLDVTDLRAASDVVLHDLLMRQFVESFKGDHWNQDYSREKFHNYLTRKPWASASPPVEDEALADTLADLAVGAGLVEK